MLMPPPRILIVDDEPSNLFLLEELMKSEGYTPFLATSGTQALKIAKDLLPDLILLDIMMPDIDGFEVCKQLRQDGELQTVPVIFLTALEDEDSRLRGLEMMGDDYFTKPININLVIKKIASTLRLSQLRSQATQSQVRQQVKEQTKRQISAAWEINEFLSEKFRLFVPEQFLDRIARQGVESIQLGNAREEELTILFCDIRGFTAIAESQTPSETFEWLNVFFTQMNQAIAANQGFIDKFLGDAIMAVFDRPGEHAQDAIAAAVMMQQRLSEFNAERDQYQLQNPVNIGIGIHSGKGIIGTVGSSYRMDSTVIGDVVNTASRLEQLTKLYSCSILVSSAVINRLTNPELYASRWIDRMMPRGKQEVIELYEVLGSATYALHEAKWRSQPDFEQGIQAWQQENFQIALSYFRQVVEQNPVDAIASLYIERCQARLNTVLPAKVIWDGVKAG